MAPEFVTSNETAVMENIPINTVVMAIKAIDRDEGRNSYIEYSLLAQTAEDDDDGPFTLGPVDGLLRVSASLDRESRANYTLHVVAYDRGLPSRSSSLDVLVRVLDENDNSPLFEPKVYSASASENATIGLSVLQMSDEELNGRVRFDTVDINDNPPVFFHSPYVVYVMEEMGQLTMPVSINRVEAHDANSSPFNRVGYLIKDEDKSLFRINGITGEISVLRSLDRETQSRYEIVVVAMDSGTFHLATSFVYCYPGGG